MEYVLSLFHNHGPSIGLHECPHVPNMPIFCGCTSECGRGGEDYGTLSLKWLDNPQSDWGGGWWWVREYADGRATPELGPFISRRDAVAERWGEGP